MQSLCAKVPIDKGEFFRKKFSENNIIDTKLMIQRIDGFLFIPLSTNAKSFNNLQNSKKWEKDIEIIEHDFKSYPERIKNYKSLIDLPSKLNDQLPTSYDIIGSVGLIKIPKELMNYSKEIGEAIIKVHKNIRTVLSDMGVTGNLRIRKYEIIAGEPNTITIHKEYGIRLMLDIAKVYFSPRLGKEHYRIAKLVQPREIVLDMFAGVGPFSILISKLSHAYQIYSIDMNKDAIEYLIKNIDRNKATNIFPLEGDVRKLINKLPSVDRIIMNLPKNAHNYLDCALLKLKSKGIIHFHDLVRFDDIDKRKVWLESVVSDHGFKLLDATEINLNSYSAKINHYCFDLNLKKV
jgi:tRNA (guanine37-N1)-methyltransferase